MDNKVNYTFVGIVVLIAIFLMLSFGYWLLKPTNEANTKKYAIYFNESVLGLNLDAPVKYKGINVGKVTKLSISPYNQEEIEVIVDIDEATPIMTSSVAQLTAQGITGLSYINLSHMQGVEAKPLEAPKDKKYPTIKAIPSLLTKAENSLGKFVISINDTMLKVQELLDEKNQKSFSKALENIASITSKIDHSLEGDSLKQSLYNIEAMTKSINNLIPRVEKMVDNSISWEDSINNSFKSIMQSYQGINSSMQSFKTSIENGELNIKEQTSEIVPTLNSTLLEMQQLMLNMQEIMDSYNKSPADMLLKQEIKKKAPGEK